MDLRAQHPLNVLTYKEIMEHVLRCHSVCLGGWDRSLSDSTATSETDSSEPHRPTYSQLVQELNCTREQPQNLVVGLDECRQVLRDNYVMPPPRTRLSIPDHSFGHSMCIPAPISHPLDIRDEPPSLRTFEQQADF
ncbi:hypothetical protein TorRG33x02_261510 [Trema orientale]|uniref:Uncharacterized protein n=1 Tax=Trema orientale TaxID=63057 RepID=A0A2P5D5U3_TREOI|nr:hypothetical protein TorRG33x02_261510 [Trema orientale]